jgi:hypothetical protein
MMTFDLVTAAFCCYSPIAIIVHFNISFSAGSGRRGPRRRSAHSDELHANHCIRRGSRSKGYGLPWSAFRFS